MKTLPKPPLIESEDYILPCRDEHSLRVGFIRAAITGLCANQDGHDAAESYIVDRAFTIAELATERYVEENSELLLKFNQKVGLK